MNSSSCDEDGDVNRERERMRKKNKVAIKVVAEENGRSLILDECC